MGRGRSRVESSCSVSLSCWAGKEGRERCSSVANCFVCRVLIVTLDEKRDGMGEDEGIGADDDGEESAMRRAPPPAEAVGFSSTRFRVAACLKKATMAPGVEASVAADRGGRVAGRCFFSGEEGPDPQRRRANCRMINEEGEKTEEKGAKEASALPPHSPSKPELVALPLLPLWRQSPS